MSEAFFGNRSSIMNVRYEEVVMESNKVVNEEEGGTEIVYELVIADGGWIKRQLESEIGRAGCAEG